MANTTQRTIRVDDETWAWLEERRRAAGDASITAYLLRRGTEEERVGMRRMRRTLLQTERRLKKALGYLESLKDSVSLGLCTEDLPDE